VLHYQLISHNITTYGRNTIKQLDGRQLRGLLPHPHDRRVGMAMLHLMASFDAEIATLEDQVAASVFRKKPVILLKTIPGIGRVLAATIFYEVGLIQRFASDKAFASYCRLAPTIAQSGAVQRQGKNRRQGNRWLKWAFSEAAQMAIQGYPSIREAFHRLLQRKRKSILAKSILAHKLAIAAFHVLRDQEPFRGPILS
jgi:transposase